MKISLLHPSRCRPNMAFHQFLNWQNKKSGTIQVEHILSLDVDDPQYDEYVRLFVGNTKIIRENPSDGYVVGATNIAAKYATGDILVYLSDDFDCPVNWDTEIAKHFDHNPRILKVLDGIHQMATKILTIPIMNRAYYEKYGYFWYPEYKSMYCDEDLYWQAHMDGAVLELPNLTFTHLHPSNPRKEMQGKNDETYTRTGAMYKQGQQLYLKRKANNFK